YMTLCHSCTFFHVVVFDGTDDAFVMCHDSRDRRIQFQVCHTITVQLNLQVIENLNQFVIVCGCKNHIVELFVDFSDFFQCFFGNCFFKAFFQAFQFCQTFCAHFLTSQTSCQTFQNTSDFQDVD